MGFVTYCRHLSTYWETGATNMWCWNQPTSRSIDYLEKQIVAQLIKKFTTFYGTRNFASPPLPQQSFLSDLLQQYPPIYAWVFQVVLVHQVYLPDSRILFSRILTILHAPRLLYQYFNMIIIVTNYGRVLNSEAGRYTVFVQRRLTSSLLRSKSSLNRPLVIVLPITRYFICIF
jgi:hypothetical protein